MMTDIWVCHDTKSKAFMVSLRLMAQLGWHGISGIQRPCEGLSAFLPVLIGFDRPILGNFTSWWKLWHKAAPDHLQSSPQPVQKAALCHRPASSFISLPPRSCMPQETPGCSIIWYHAHLKFWLPYGILLTTAETSLQGYKSALPQVALLHQQ